MTDKNKFFTQLKSLYSKETIDYEGFSPYLALLYCSHDKDSFEYVEKISRYVYIIKPKYIFQYLWHKLPYNRSKFLKWTKKAKLDNDDRIEAVMIEHNISRHEALQYDI